MRDILISGIDSLVGIHLAAHYLASSDDNIWYLTTGHRYASEETIGNEVWNTLEQIAPIRGAETIRRLHRVEVGHAGDELRLPNVTFRADQVWYLGAWRPGNGETAEHSAEAATLQALLSILPNIGTREFNYVGPKGEQEIEEQCQAHQIGYRWMRPSVIVGKDNRLRKPRGGEFLLFLQILHDVKVEIEERLPEYFQLQSLRCCAPADARVNLIAVADAIAMMARLAGQEETLGRHYYIAAPSDTSLESLCERVGTMYGLSLLVVQDRKELNAIDQILDERWGGVRTYLTLPQQSLCNSRGTAMEIATEGASIDEEEQLVFLEAAHRSQEANRAARRQRVAGLPAILTKETIDRDGLELTYYAGGEKGSLVVLLHALGQRLDYWYRLVEQLTHYHRVILWEPRGITSPPHPLRLTDHVADLDSILRREAVDSCHLACWCTGPKVAVEFYLQRADAVRSMVFLNSTFKCFDRPQEFETDYEHNLESLCRVVDGRPGIAGSVMKSMQTGSASEATELLLEMESKELARHVLSLVNVDLRPYLLSPFQTPFTTVNYARQLIDFWSHDTTLKANQVKAPVLFIAAEYDQIASPAASQAAAQIFPLAQYIQVQGATHYCLYDRPDLIADLMEAFFDGLSSR